MKAQSTMRTDLTGAIGGIPCPQLVHAGEWDIGRDGGKRGEEYETAK